MHGVFSAFTSFAQRFQMSPKTKVDILSKFLLIGPSKKINKLALGFFLDRYQANTQADKEYLSKYEWFAGSLTTEQFAKSLIEFLKSNESAGLSESLKGNISKFVSALEHSKDQGYLIDLIRARDLKLIYMILTGNKVEANISASQAEISELSSEVLKQVNQMNVGDKRIFLTGNLLHETRLSIEKKDEGSWTIDYFDSNFNHYKSYNADKNSPIFTTDFWNRMHQIKLDLDCNVDIPTLLSSIGQENKELVKEGFSLPQSKNTCFFKSLMAALKKECVSAPHEDINKVVTDWKEFKIKFGMFLSLDENLDKQIVIHTAKQQERRMAKLDQRRLQLNATEEIVFKKTIEEYKQVFELLDSTLEIKSCTSNLETLKDLDDQLYKLLPTRVIQFQSRAADLKKITSPPIQSILRQFDISFQNVLVKVEAKLAEEFKMKSEKSNPPFSDKEMKAFSDKLSDLNYYPLSRDKVQQWIDKFEVQPDLLSNLDQKPAFACILFHSIFLGMTNEVRNLYDKMSAHDRSVVELTIMLSDPLLKSFPSEHLPKSVLIDCSQHPDHDLSKFLSDIAIEQAFKINSLQNLYLIEKIQPGKIRTCSKRIGLLKPTKEQIVQFFEFVRENGAKPINESKARVAFLNHLITHIIQTGNFDLIVKVPPILLQDYQMPHINLTEEQQDAFEKFIKDRPNLEQSKFEFISSKRQ